MRSTLSILVLLISFHPGIADASGSHVATVVQTVGKVEIFTHPSKTPHANQKEKEGTMALFEGQYYLIQEAKVGDRIENQNILRTYPDSKARVTYENGDQFYVGPGTTYRISWSEASAEPPQIEFSYGRLRSVIQKEGPRRKMMIRTRAATMGVRGTDFFVADAGVNQETEISVLRGSVEVENKKGQKEQVKSGMTADVNEATELRETTKQDLGNIRDDSTLPKATETPSPEIAKLEKKAVEVVRADVLLYQPEFAKRLGKSLQNVNSVQDLNDSLVRMAVEHAPNAPNQKRKPKSSDLKDTDQTDFYKKYFKSEK